MREVVQVVLDVQWDSVSLALARPFLKHTCTSATALTGSDQLAGSGLGRGGGPLGEGI